MSVESQAKHEKIKTEFTSWMKEEIQILLNRPEGENQRNDYFHQLRKSSETEVDYLKKLIDFFAKISDQSIKENMTSLLEKYNLAINNPSPTVAENEIQQSADDVNLAMMYLDLACAGTETHAAILEFFKQELTQTSSKDFSKFVDAVEQAVFSAINTKNDQEIEMACQSFSKSLYEKVSALKQDGQDLKTINCLDDLVKKNTQDLISEAASLKRNNANPIVSQDKAASHAGGAKRSSLMAAIGGFRRNSMFKNQPATVPSENKETPQAISENPQNGDLLFIKNAEPEPLLKAGR